MAIAYVASVPQRFCFPLFVWHWLVTNEIDFRLLLQVDSELEGLLKKTGIPFEIDSWTGSQIVLRPDLEVDESNRQLFAELAQRQRIRELEPCLAALRRGFLAVLGGQRISLFSALEWETLVCGRNEITDDDLRALFVVDGDQWELTRFLDAVLAFGQDERSKLLQFATGSPVLPLPEFRPIRITITFLQGTRLPIAHTCFPQLDVGLCQSVEELREKILYAINNCETFEAR